jgi:hypothetical protein
MTDSKTYVPIPDRSNSLELPSPSGSRTAKGLDMPRLALTVSQMDVATADATRIAIKIINESSQAIRIRYSTWPHEEVTLVFTSRSSGKEHRLRCRDFVSLLSKELLLVLQPQESYSADISPYYMFLGLSQPALTGEFILRGELDYEGKTIESPTIDVMLKAPSGK